MLKSTRSTDVAILGYGCRLPGADGPEEFWDVLRDQRCTVTEIQPDRWPREAFGHPDPAARGKSYVWAAGQLDDPWAFDPDFFGISPREAEQMDPQQRLILQVAWEALEHANLPPSSLPKERTGVYIGASSSDYSNRFYLDPASIDSQFMTGNSLSLISNRLSYALDLRGPSQTVDTACSSGLYALHDAVRALREGLIDTAIVGAVNMLLSPFPFVGFSRASMLSRTGLCRAFDAAGDGYVRSEGAVVFVLRAEHAAIAEGDRIRGYVVATGVNTDGRTSGVSQPSAAGQAALLRAVYDDAGIEPADLAFVEAHGTGTAVGDPVEASAIGTVLGARRGRPLPIGSVKTNLGHLEAGAGLVGLLKAQLALEHGALPASLHFETPNPSIDFNALNIRVAASGLDLPAEPEAPCFAGVNSFGFGGANGHAVLRRASPPARDRHAAPGPLILSARSEESLARLAGRYAARLAAATEAEASDIANAAAYRRERLPCRLVVPATDRASQIKALKRCAADPAGGGAGRAGAAGGTAFVFSGNGAQWAGMGRAAHAGDPAFRAAFDRVSALHAARGGADLIEALHDPALEGRLARTSLAQPLLFAIQVGVVESLARAGLRPDAVLGHSVGEVAAAWAAGVFTLEDATRLIGVRSAAQETLRGLGGMAAVAAPAGEIAARLDAEGLADIWVAADNSPRGATVSGTAGALDAFAEIAAEARWPVRRLALEYPFHSGFADRMRDALLADLDWLTPDEASTPFVSSACGRRADGHELGPAYWWRNIREPVHFRQGVAEMAEAGCGVFVEIGPRPVLRGYLRDCLAVDGAPFRYAPTLDETGGDARATVANALTLGARIDELVFFGPDIRPAVDLPRNPWRNRKFQAADTPEATTLLQPSACSPLLGQPARADAFDWRREIGPASPFWMADHVVQDAVVAPAAALIEMAFAVGAEALAAEPEDAPPAIELRNFAIHRPIALDGGGRELRVNLSGERHALRIETRPRLSAEPWAVAATGRLRHAYAAPPMPSAPAGAGAVMDGSALYPALAARGLSYGPAFRLARQVTITGPAEAIVALDPPAEEAGRPHLLHPASLDAALHGLLALLDADGADGLHLPVSVETARLHHRSAHIRAARVTVVRRSSRSVTANILLLSADGVVVASFENFRFKAAPVASRPDPELRRYETRLVPILAPGASGPDLSAIIQWGVEAGLLSEAPGDEDPSADLIAEAAAQRICLDAIASAGGPLAARLRAMAEAEGLLGRDPDGGPIEDPATAPPDLPRLLEALIAEAPRSAGLVAYLSRLAAELVDAPGIDAGLSPTRAERAALARDKCAGERWRALTDLAAAALAWPETPRGCSVLLLGAPPRSCLGVLAALPLHRLWVVDPDGGDPCATPGDVALHRSADALADGPRFDLVLACDPLAPPRPEVLALAAGNLAPGGAVLAPIPRPGVLSRLASDNRPALRPASGLAISGRAYLPSGADGLAVLAGSFGPAQQDRADPEDNHPDAAGVRLIGSEARPAFTTAVEQALATIGLHSRPGGDVVFLSDAPDGAAEIAERMMALHPLLAGPSERRPRRIWIATTGGVPAGDAATRPGDAAIWGLARVLANEFPDTEFRLVDLNPEASDDANAARLATHVAAPGAEREIAFRLDGDFAVRVVRPAPRPPEGAQLRLAQARHGDIESLGWRPAPRPRPAGAEIEIEVAAVGLNFRDVMWAQGLLPEEALEHGFAGPTLGMECAGTVVATGPDATRFRPGDQVIAYAANCFAQRVVTPETAAAVIPPGVDIEAAAAISTAFLTARYALAELARLRPGEIVVIHGAAGGVGLAAIQIAAAEGARVIATAGTPAKRALARRLGAEAVFDGRSPGFADAVLKATGGEGVDVVLNSLAGEAMERSLECLRPFGRFVELGKRDFYADSEIGLRPFRQNLSYFGVDADQMMKERPDLAARLLAELGAAFAAGDLAPPPVTVFDAEDAVAAFRLMQKSGHLGKILIRPPAPPPTARATAPLRSDGAYLVIGGLSGFGAATAERLAEKGARRLHLSGRRGAPGVEGEKAIARMRAAGAQVTLHAADAADEGAMRALLDQIDADGAPLRGVVHAAMVLDDGLFATQSRAQIEQVLRPKTDGAALIDRLTRERGDALDFFVAYSSATTLVGNPGQAAYVAANAWLEALMRNRRRDGLPGLAVAWGAVADAGVLARDAETSQALASRLGAVRMTAAEALDALDGLLHGDDPAPVFGDIDWVAARRELALTRTPLFEALDLRDSAAPPPAGALVDRLREMPAPEALAELLAVLSAEAAQILRMPVAEVEPTRPLTEMGFDSLMAMDLRMTLEERLGVEVPLMSLAGGAALRDVARLALDRLGERTPADAEAAVVDLVMERHVAGTEDGVSRDDVARFAERAKSTESLLA